ncbi:VOC family protein [uncultured Tateyamaria sp.]|uniref:VOC family protein n=1 Tax=uncultured Tateyamaria sp. TaxID=455651 RepID=UPI00262DD1DD|nr:VOC family protein [uncultured Tateyamaria sp.]
MSLRLALLKIPVSDLARSVPFYETVLGQPAAFVAAEFGWAQFHHPEPGLALYVPGQGGGDRTPGGSVDFHLSAQDIDALRDRIAAIADTARIHENADGSRSLEFKDPDGNDIKIMGASQ